MSHIRMISGAWPEFKVIEMSFLLNGDRLSGTQSVGGWHDARH